MARKDWMDQRPALEELPSYKEFHEISALLKEGDVAQLEFAMAVVDSFPHGKDPFVGSNWIMHAVDFGNLRSLEWMIEKDVDLRVDDGGGYTLLLNCLECENDARYQILELLIQSGADLNLRGVNGWTPLHMAAIRDDFRAMEILLKAGADRTIRTEIDDNTTAEEEARALGHIKSSEFIRDFP